MPERAARPSGRITMLRKPPVEVAIVRSDVWVISKAPPSRIAASTTSAPGVATSARSGSATSAPIHPPAEPRSSKPAEILSGPLTRWRRPSSATLTSDQPMASRNGLDERPRRTNAMPLEINPTGTRYRPIPVNHPIRVSIPRPTGPARLT